MTIFRRGSSAFAAGVLLAQLCVFAIVAVAPAFCCPRASASAATPDCCKGKGHSCPLMKKAAVHEHDAEGETLRSCSSSDERIASLLFGTTGVLVSVAPLSTPGVVAELEHDLAHQPVYVSPAEAPPPRA